MTSKTSSVTSLLSLSLTVAAPVFSAAEPVDFTTQVKPILESTCVHCHNEKEHKGDYRLDTLAEALKSPEDLPGLVPGKPEESLIYTTACLPADDDDVMPPKKDGPPLSKEQTDILKQWIADGAKWPDGVKLEQKPRISFEKHIQPILEVSCVGCHNPQKKEEYGNYDCTTRTAAMTTGDEEGGELVPFHPEKSLFYKLTVLAPDKKRLMPPKNNGGPLPADQIELIRAWIEQGAVWPDAIPPLAQKERREERPPNPDNIELVKKIHAAILAKSSEKAEGDMKEYQNVVPKTGAKYTMVPVKGGTFLMGSPEGEKDRKPDEGPQVKATVEPFWMGKFEVTWDEYLPFQTTPIDRYKDGAKKTPNPADAPVDIVSSPTSPYTEMSFGMGQDGFPAISMTEHAALKYCEWLSAQTGHFYRLPTEAEWEYACRAGTTTAYSFGDDASKLDDYAWYFNNSLGSGTEEQYQKIGTRKPNPWGLHDMHGNVVEWVLDQYDAEGYKKWGAEVSNPWNKPSTLWGRACRGGSYSDNADALRSAARKFSKEAWKSTDPQLPKSIWYLTDAKWIGFRLVRPLRTPSPEEMHYIWNCGRPEGLAKAAANK